MHSKNCCVLFLLVLVACQAAPSHKITEKSIKETEAKLAKEDLNLEDTGADKDRAKKSTTFCVQVHSGKEEIVPCNQEVNQPIVKSLDFSKSLTQPASASLVQYPNILVQQPQVPQPSSNVFLHQSKTFTPQVIPQPTIVQIPAKSEQSASITAPQQHIVHVESQHPSALEPISLVHSQQSVLPSSISIQTPTNDRFIPAPASAPCETLKTESQQPSKIHTLHLVQSLQPALKPETRLIPLASQPSVIHEVKPNIKLEQESLLPLPQQELSAPIAHLPCKSDMILAPPSMEFVYHEQEPKLVEYVPLSQEAYECSCRSEQQTKLKPSSSITKHHVTLYPNNGHMSLKSPLTAVQYNPIIGSEDASPVFATQTRKIV